MVRNAPVLIPVIYLTACLVIAILRPRYRGLAHIAACIAAAGAAAVSFGLLFRVAQVGPMVHYFGGWVPPIGIEYVVDPLSAFVLMVINVIAALVMVHVRDVNRVEINTRVIPYYAVVMLMMLGLNGIVLTGDFFNLFVFLEISSLSAYALIAVGERGSAFAAFRYLILGTVGASLYLLGLGFLYLKTGSLNMADLASIIPYLREHKDPALIIALVLMTVGVGIKMAIFPLHGWLVDAYSLAPSGSSALIAPIGAKVASYVLIRTLFDVFGVDFVSREFPLTAVLGWLAAAGIIYGSVMAIAQNELKRMLAYSSVAQIGYIGLGIAMANPLGLIGAILHVLNHAVMKACLFMVAANLRIKVGHSDISRFDASYRIKMPWTMAAFTVAAISMIGLPPLAGFFSKWYLVLATVENAQWVFLAVILISSLLNAVYFFRVIEKVYLRSPSEMPTDEPMAISISRIEAVPSMLMPVLVCALLLLLLGVFNALIVTVFIQPMMPGGM